MPIIDEIISFVKKHNIQEFRAKQLIHGIYKEGKTSFVQIRTLPQKIQQLFSDNLKICSLNLITSRLSHDKTTKKYLLSTLLLHFLTKFHEVMKKYSKKVEPKLILFTLICLSLFMNFIPFLFICSSFSFTSTFYFVC